MDDPTNGVYADRVLSCGCRGVPEGQHLPGCRWSETLPAARCIDCGLRTATVAVGRKFFCGQCGAQR